VLKADSRYLFDKLLHNDYVLKPERPATVCGKCLWPEKAGCSGAN
jgi:hypothetical protein